MRKGNRNQEPGICEKIYIMRIKHLVVLAVASSGFLVIAQEVRTRVRPLPPAAINAKTGPGVGTKLPAFQATDQNGKTQTFETLRGPKGMLLVFARSADWCPYCKTQLADLNTQVAEFRKKGIGLASITYDSTAVLKDFAGRVGIGYPMLSDPESKIIKTFGIFNDNVDPKSAQYGIPFPGIYRVDAKGVVIAKYFEEDYRERYSAATILSHEFGADGVEKTVIDSSQVTLTTSVSDAKAAPGHRITLILDIEPKAASHGKMHLYAPGVKNYIPIDWQMGESKAISAEAVKYPASRMLNLPPIHETVPIYDKRIRLTRDIVVGQENEVAPVIGEARLLTVEGAFKYQACDDRECFLPKTVPLKWTLKLAKLDTTRPAAEVQRKMQ
jgi:peroxiredoxin